MSERRRKQERDETQAYEKEAIERLREENWWNTSSRLQVRCPKIDRSPGWLDFIKDYDKTENQERRLMEWYLSRKWKGTSMELVELIDLAEEATEENPEAGKKLGLKILAIIDGGPAFNDFVEGVKLGRQRLSGVREAVWALKQFAERTEKLPTRAELNREAYRIKNLKRRVIPWKKWFEKHSQMDEFNFGDRFGSDRKERIYWMQFDHEAEEVCIQTFPDKEDAKKDVRWPNGPTFSMILGKAGLRGLQ